MNLHHGDLVSLYDYNGNFECRGHIVGINRSNPSYFDIQPCEQYSIKKRMNGIPAARIRKHYVAPHMVDESPKHILDEA